MKYRVKLDLSFSDEADARALIGQAAAFAERAVNINSGRVDEEISFYELEACHHEEGQPCETLQRVTIPGA